MTAILTFRQSAILRNKILKNIYLYNLFSDTTVISFTDTVICSEANREYCFPRTCKKPLGQQNDLRKRQYCPTLFPILEQRSYISN
jgi:hypothetical protein